MVQDCLGRASRSWLWINLSRNGISRHQKLRKESLSKGYEIDTNRRVLLLLTDDDPIIHAGHITTYPQAEPPMETNDIPAILHQYDSAVFSSVA